MTRKEAIGNLKYAISWNDMPMKEAMMMAVEALEQEPCNDCISRKEVLEYIDNMPSELTADGRRMIRRRTLEEYISDTLPPVDPQPKIGHWIVQDIHNCHTDFQCSNCGYIHNFMHLFCEPTADYTYCPRCGAKMQEVKE